MHGIGHTSANMPVATVHAPAAKVSSEAAAKAPPSAPNEDVVQLACGALSAANPQMIGDFRNDMGQLSQFVGAEVAIDTQRDCLVIRGGAQERRAAKEELLQILTFYKIRCP